jgi:hypothetical protein
MYLLHWKNMYTLHVISLELTGNPCKFYRDIPTNYIITWSPHSWYMISLHLMWGIPIVSPVNQIPFKYYNGNQSEEISKLQGLQVTCNPHKFEIPALRFPRKYPVNPCKHLQCIFFRSFFPLQQCRARHNWLWISSLFWAKKNL